MGTPSSQQLQESLDNAFDMVGDDETAPVAQPEYEAPRRTTRTRRSSRSTAVTKVKVSSVPQYLGVLLILGAFFLAAAPQLGLKESALSMINSSLGITPGLLFMTGILLAGLAWLLATGIRSSTRALSSQVGSELSTIGAEVADMAEEAKNANPNAFIESELDEHRQIFAKLETMVGNLTKAVRMHNKPLVDLVGMVTDLSKQNSDSLQEFQATKRDLEAIERGLGESTAANEKHWEGMFQRLHGSENEIETHLEHSRDVIFERLEKYIITENERLAQEVETHCDMLREQLEKMVQSSETKTTDEIRGIASTVEELAKAKPAAAAFDPKVLAGLERNLQQVRDTVELLASRPAPAAAPSLSAAPSAPAPTLGSDGPATTQSSAPAPKPAANASDDGDEEAPGGKRVLSAIERLKQMRGN